MEVIPCILLDLFNRCRWKGHQPAKKWSYPRGSKPLGFNFYLRLVCANSPGQNQTFKALKLYAFKTIKAHTVTPHNRAHLEPPAHGRVLAAFPRARTRPPYAKILLTRVAFSAAPANPENTTPYATFSNTNPTGLTTPHMHGFSSHAHLLPI